MEYVATAAKVILQEVASAQSAQAGSSPSTATPTETVATGSSA